MSQVKAEERVCSEGNIQSLKQRDKIMGNTKEQLRDIADIGD